jgi:hypothetical protein
VKRYPEPVFDDAVDAAERRRIQAEQEAAEKQAALERRRQHLRETMPLTAKAVDDVRRVFGPDIRVNWAIENGQTVGPVPQEVLRRHGLLPPLPEGAGEPPDGEDES